MCPHACSANTSLPSGAIYKTQRWVFGFNLSLFLVLFCFEMGFYYVALALKTSLFLEAQKVFLPLPPQC